MLRAIETIKAELTERLALKPRLGQTGHAQVLLGDAREPVNLARQLDERPRCAWAALHGLREALVEYESCSRPKRGEPETMHQTEPEAP